MSASLETIQRDFSKAYFDAAVSGNATPLVNFAEKYNSFLTQTYGIDAYRMFNINPELIKKIESFQLKPVNGIDLNNKGNAAEQKKLEIDYNKVIIYTGLSVAVIGLFYVLNKN